MKNKAKTIKFFVTLKIFNKDIFDFLKMKNVFKVFLIVRISVDRLVIDRQLLFVKENSTQCAA